MPKEPIFMMPAVSSYGYLVPQLNFEFWYIYEI